MSFERTIIISSLLITFLLATTLSIGRGSSGNSFVVLLSAQQHQDITATQKTNRIMVVGKNKVSIFHMSQLINTVTWSNNETIDNTVTSRNRTMI